MEESLVLKQNLRPLIPTDTPLHYPKLEILKTCEETEVIGVKRLSVSKAYSVARREEIERWGQNRRTCSGKSASEAWPSGSLSILTCWRATSLCRTTKSPVNIEFTTIIIVSFLNKIRATDRLLSNHLPETSSPPAAGAGCFRTPVPDASSVRDPVTPQRQRRIRKSPFLKFALYFW